MRWGEAGALVVWAFNLVPGFPGGWVQYIYWKREARMAFARPVFAEAAGAAGAS